VSGGKGHGQWAKALIAVAGYTHGWEKCALQYINCNGEGL